MSQFLLMETKWTVEDANESVRNYINAGFIAHWKKDSLSDGFNIYVKERLFGIKEVK